MKKSEMKIGTIYIICPDRKCHLFWDTSTYCLCEGRCPLKESEKFVVLCSNCREPIVFDHRFNSWNRIDHKCPDYKGGGVASTFIDGTRHYLLYEMPTE
jgi:hypothetical protein